MSDIPCSTNSKLNLLRAGLGVLCLVLFGGCASIQPTAEHGKEKFQFGFIGDQQYDAESDAKFPHLMKELNVANLAFVVHVGDFRGSGFRCDDDVFEKRKRQFDTSKHPFIYTPGDNDWTDCHGHNAGNFDPAERLVTLRKVFFAGNQSLGQRRMNVTRQSDSPQFSKFRENARWTYGNILFITLHIVGSNNNRGRTPDADTEYRERNAANLAWLKEAFIMAKREGNKGVAIFMQANPVFEYRLPPRRGRALRIRPVPKRPSGFSDFLTTLEPEVLAYGRPVILFHGDTHYFRVDKPLFRSNEAGPRKFGRQIENFTRVETFGDPESHWVRVIVDPNDPQVFTIKQQIVDSNRFARR